MAKPILTISTLSPDRPEVSIDGRLYEMLLPEDFGLRDQAKLRAMYAKWLDLYDLDPEELTEEQAARLSELLREFVWMVIPGVAEESRERAKDRHLIPLMEAFGQAIGATPATPTQAPNRASRRTTGKSSRRSNASTAATPTAGLTSSRRS